MHKIYFSMLIPTLSLTVDVIFCWDSGAYGTSGVCLLLIFILISPKQETLYGPQVQGLQINSSYYTWLPLDYITSECNALYQSIVDDKS